MAPKRRVQSPSLPADADQIAQEQEENRRKWAQLTETMMRAAGTRAPLLACVQLFCTLRLLLPPQAQQPLARRQPQEAAQWARELLEIISNQETADGRNPMVTAGANQDRSAPPPDRAPAEAAANQSMAAASARRRPRRLERRIPRS